MSDGEYREEYAANREIKILRAQLTETQRELDWHKTRADKLEQVIKLMQHKAFKGYRAWDSDLDVMAGKCLAALAGISPGYWPDIDAFMDALFCPVCRQPLPYGTEATHVCKQANHV